MKEFERALWENGLRVVAGVDEAGRGSLAGPVVAAAVVFDPSNEIPSGLDDSKKLSPEVRSVLFDKIYASAKAVGVGVIGQEEIDTINILQATFNAMRCAVNQLGTNPDHVLIDGNRAPDLYQPCSAIVKGDSRSVSIAAASIIAKVSRDRIMTGLHPHYPQYGFQKNKGYATPFHIHAIKTCGISPQHRVTFCRKIINSQMSMW